MMRYLRLYGKFIEFSFSKAMEFRVDFYFRSFMDLMYYAVSFAFFKILYLHTPDIGGWNESQAMVFVGCFIVIDGIQMTLFANNTWFLPMAINSGDLDYYLVRPVSSFFMLNLREFAANSFMNLAMAIGFMVYTLVIYPEPLGVVNLILFLIFTFNGAMIFQLMRIISILPVFWTHGGRGLDSLFWTMEKFAERPHRIYTGVVKVIMLTVLPFSLMSSVPTDILFQDNPWESVAVVSGITVVLFALVLWFWNFAIKNYSSASS